MSSERETSTGTPVRDRPLRLWIMSDLHMETTRGWDLPAKDSRPDYDVMVVAGDLITRMERGVKWLLDRVDDRPVVYCMGNHEAWGVDVDRTVEKAMALADGTNVHVLERRAVEIGGVAFAGCCLWTDYDLVGDRRGSMVEAGERMNDFKRIRTARYLERFLPRHALSRHLESRAFLETVMGRARGEQKLVVATHHAPLPLAEHIALRGAGGSPTASQLLDASYRSDLSALMVPKDPADGGGVPHPADLWAFGHTHESFDAVVGATRVVSNGKGYGPWHGDPGWENRSFDPGLVVEV
jgi:predicted phosphodiesterase